MYRVIKVINTFVEMIKNTDKAEIKKRKLQLIRKFLTIQMPCQKNLRETHVSFSRELQGKNKVKTR